MQTAGWRGARLRGGLLLAVAATLCVLWWTGAFGDLTEPERIRALLADTGSAGPLLWLLAFVVVQPFGVPGALFLIPAGLVWSPAFAIPMCLAGATGAGAFSFALARWIGPDAIDARLPERARRYTARAREHGFRTALMTRLVLFLFAPAHWALGISGIRFTPFLLGSAVGFLPGMILWVLGTRVFAYQLDRLPWWQAVGLGVSVLAMAAGAFWLRRRRATNAVPR